VQLIEHILQQIPADVAGWLAIVAGLAAYAVLLRWLDPTRKVVVPNVIAAAPPVRRFETGFEFQKVMDVSLAELVRAPDLGSIQARAAAQIDAAEHAFNRLLAECAQVSTPLVTPTFEPLRQLAREPEAAPVQQQPLAA